MLRDECVWNCGDVTIFLTPILDWGLNGPVPHLGCWPPESMLSYEFFQKARWYIVTAWMMLRSGNPCWESSPGFSCRLGRGLVNNWVYLTEESDFRGEKLVSNATRFMFMLSSGAGDRFVLTQLQLIWLWNHSHWRDTTPCWRVEGATGRIHIR